MESKEIAYDESKVFEFSYKNYKGQVSKRRVIPIMLTFGNNRYYSENKDSWYLTAYDLDKKENRDFAIDRINKPKFEHEFLIKRCKVTNFSIIPYKEEAFMRLVKEERARRKSVRKEKKESGKTRKTLIDIRKEHLWNFSREYRDLLLQELSFNGWFLKRDYGISFGNNYELYTNQSKTIPGMYKVSFLVNIHLYPVDIERIALELELFGLFDPLELPHLVNKIIIPFCAKVNAEKEKWKPKIIFNLSHESALGNFIIHVNKGGHVYKIDGR